VGLYVSLLRRYLEHFFPDATFEPASDRSVIWVDSASQGVNHRIHDDPNGVGVLIEWFQSLYWFLPGSPSPFLPSERRLIEATTRLLDRRFQSLFNVEVLHREELYEFQIEDLVLAEELQTPDAMRIPSAIEALRVAALSTYENRRVSSGVLLLGTEIDPAEPGRRNPPGAPRYGTRLSAIKSFHRLCDGLRTVFIVDRRGDLVRVTDVADWAATTQPDTPLAAPLPRDYVHHARATLTGEHVLLALTAAQEIKVFAHGTMAYAFSDARWRLLDTTTKYNIWRQAFGKPELNNLADRIYQAAINLCEDRRGALFVVLRDPEQSLKHLITPGDQILAEVPTDDPDDPDNLAPRLAKRSIHHVARGRSVHDLQSSVLEAMAGVDGAFITDFFGRILSFGAILRLGPESMNAPRAVEGARTTAAIAASYHGPVLKVSEDGFVTMFLGGRRVWEM
jgi:DNA integrity scanning protein DisA with diadenylate cyclase activity